MAALRHAKRLSPGRGWRAVRHFVYATPFYSLTLKGGAPESLHGLPPESWPGDPKAAGAIVDGDPWSGLPLTEKAAAALHGFGWLADLRALGTAAARERARQLVGGWLDSHGRWSAVPWRPDILGSRLSNWFASHMFLLSGADEAFRRRFLQSVSAQARHLGRVADTAPGDADAFPAIKGLIHCGICIPGNGDALKAGLRLLEQETDSQILPDGGHVQRNPSLLMCVMGHLIDIREALDSARLEVPTFVQGAIDRMAPMLRGFRLGDGGLALFNGGAEEDRAHIDSLLARAAAKGKALSSAPHTGFQRLSAGRTVVIIDSGSPQSDQACRHAHAGALSFEMSVGKHRLVVNCGAHPSGDSRWRSAMGATAAHSSLCVDDTNSSQVLAGGGVTSRPREITCTRREADGHTWLETSHDGYGAALGLIHRRNLYLDASGRDFRGEDILSGSGGREFVVRFHLHPHVHASLVGDGSAVLLKLSGGAGWRFRAAAGVLAIEESVYLGGGGDARRGEQITVSGPLSGDGASVKWAFCREG